VDVGARFDQLVGGPIELDADRMEEIGAEELDQVEMLAHGAVAAVGQYARKALEVPPLIWPQVDLVTLH
jgi:hypothetical protein